jgi:hypothetical protein
MDGDDPRPCPLMSIGLYNEPADRPVASGAPDSPSGSKNRFLVLMGGKSVRRNRADTWFMRKIIATVVVLSLILIGYTAWPLYNLFVLVRAIETRDVDTVMRHVYFDQVRISLTNQVVAAYVRRTGIQISPLARSMAAAALSIADPVVKKLISPEALSELLAVG